MRLVGFLFCLLSGPAGQSDESSILFSSFKITKINKKERGWLSGRAPYERLDFVCQRGAVVQLYQGIFTLIIDLVLLNFRRRFLNEIFYFDFLCFQAYRTEPGFIPMSNQSRANTIISLAEVRAFQEENIK